MVSRGSRLATIRPRIAKGSNRIVPTTPGRAIEMRSKNWVISGGSKMPCDFMSCTPVFDASMLPATATERGNHDNTRKTSLYAGLRQNTLSAAPQATARMNDTKGANKHQTSQPWNSGGSGSHDTTGPNAHTTAVRAVTINKLRKRSCGQVSTSCNAANPIPAIGAQAQASRLIRTLSAAVQRNITDVPAKSSASSRPENHNGIDSATIRKHPTVESMTATVVPNQNALK